MKVVSKKNLNSYHKKLKNLLDTGNIHDVTYAQAITLRDNNQFIPGHYYRITDYTMTVNPALTHITSDGIVLPIVLLATSTNTLNENGICSNGVRVKYTLDNNPDNYEWALNVEESIHIEFNSWVYSGTYIYGGKIENTTPEEDTIYTPDTEHEWYDWYYIDANADDPTERHIAISSRVPDFNAIVAGGQRVYYADLQGSWADTIWYDLMSDEVADCTHYDAQTGKGVVYWMQDKNNNEAYFDFINYKYDGFYLFTGKNYEESGSGSGNKPTSYINIHDYLTKKHSSDYGDSEQRCTHNKFYPMYNSGKVLAPASYIVVNLMDSEDSYAAFAIENLSIQGTIYTVSTAQILGNIFVNVGSTLAVDVNNAQNVKLYKQAVVTYSRRLYPSVILPSYTANSIPSSYNAKELTLFGSYTEEPLSYPEMTTSEIDNIINP